MIEAKVIEGTFGLYSATESGEIISTRTGQPLKGAVDGCGYKRVCLSFKDGQVTKKVHRLIAETFIENEQRKPQVNHKNGNKLDNKVENLEWCTGSENVIHAFNELGRVSSGGHKGKLGINHHASIPVKAINPLGEVFVFGSMKEAERYFPGTNARRISDVCLGKRKTHNGCKWETLQ